MNLVQPGAPQRLTEAEVIALLRLSISAVRVEVATYQSGGAVVATPVLVSWSSATAQRYCIPSYLCGAAQAYGSDVGVCVTATGCWLFHTTVAGLELLQTYVQASADLSLPTLPVDAVLDARPDGIARMSVPQSARILLQLGRDYDTPECTMQQIFAALYNCSIPRTHRVRILGTEP